MQIEDFLAKVAAHPELEVERRDSTIIILRRQAADGSHVIRIGTWAIERIRWEEFLKAWKLRPARQGPATASRKRSAASNKA